MKRIVLDVEDDFHAEIKVRAAQEERTLKEILTELIKRWLKRN